jgi:hypothetical protein
MEKLTFESVNPGDVLSSFIRSVSQETFWKYAVASFDYNPVLNGLKRPNPLKFLSPSGTA